MGVSYFSKSMVTLNTAITSKFLTLLLESSFKQPYEYNIYTHLRIPRKIGSIKTLAAATQQDSQKAKKEPHSGIPMDHFATKLFECEKRVLILSDTLRDYSDLCASITSSTSDD